jgi:microcystin-dependent protein
MGTPFLGEIRIVSFNFAPRNWALCNGQLLPINQNQALFALMGTMYGGNGQTTFGLPDLRGRTPIHVGNGFTQGERAGEENHTLLLSELPAHTHTANARNTAANTDVPTNNLPAQTPIDMYANSVQPVVMAPQMVGNTGGSQPHNNMQPYLVLNFCVALTGIFPSQN